MALSGTRNPESEEDWEVVCASRAESARLRTCREEETDHWGHITRKVRRKLKCTGGWRMKGRRAPLPGTRRNDCKYDKTNITCGRNRIPGAGLRALNRQKAALSEPAAFRSNEREHKENAANPHNYLTEHYGPPRDRIRWRAE